MALKAGAIVYETEVDESGLKDGLVRSEGRIKISSTTAANSLSGLNERMRRLNSLLGRSKIGSQRFKNLQKEIDVTKAKMDGAIEKSESLGKKMAGMFGGCLLYTSDAADE